MINPFLKPAEKAAEDVPQGILIAVSANCMTCYEVVDEAEYFPVDKLLIWICIKGHKSVIENFNLGV